MGGGLLYSEGFWGQVHAPARNTDNGSDGGDDDDDGPSKRGSTLMA